MEIDAFVQLEHIGMKLIVWSVLMGKYGIKILKNVFAQQGFNGVE